MEKIPITLEEATAFFSEIYGGEHHIPSEIKQKQHSDGYYILTRGDLSSFDFNRLTRILFLCHDKCYRVEMKALGMKVAIFLHKRYKRKGSVMECHPTIEDALAKWRETHPENSIVSYEEE